MASRTEASSMYLVERVSYKLLHVGCYCWWNGASQVALVGKNAANVGNVRDARLIPGMGRSSGKGHGNPFQHSCLENPMDRGACQARVHGVPKSQTRLKGLSTAHSFYSDTILGLKTQEK